MCVCIFFRDAAAQRGPGAPQYRGFTQTRHTCGTPVDQPDLETSSWQQQTFTRDRRVCAGGIRTRNPSKRSAAYTRLRPRGRWGRRMFLYSV